MDPWLESAALWPGVHDALIVYLAHDLNSRIAPAYVAVPGGRLVVEEPARNIYPDVVVTEARPTGGGAAPSLAVEEPVIIHLNSERRRQTFVEIRDTRSGNRVVTIIEVLSPSNKEPGQDARDQYLRKQAEVLASDVHLVEIDLLRSGAPTVAVPPPRTPPGHYRVVIRRAGARDRGEVYAIPLSRHLPRVRVPLREGEADASADLQALLERVYREGCYGDLIDYDQPPEPPLRGTDERWAREVLARPR